jgi:hypothetical protein
MVKLVKNAHDMSHEFRAETFAGISTSFGIDMPSRSKGVVEMYGIMKPMMTGIPRVRCTAKGCCNSHIMFMLKTFVLTLAVYYLEA